MERIESATIEFRLERALDCILALEALVASLRQRLEVDGTVICATLGSGRHAFEQHQRWQEMVRDQFGDIAKERDADGDGTPDRQERISRIAFWNEVFAIRSDQGTG